MDDTNVSVIITYWDPAFSVTRVMAFTPDTEHEADLYFFILERENKTPNMYTTQFVKGA